MCQEHKYEIKTDGKFAYYECSVCKEVGSVIYIEAEAKDESWEEDLLGI